MEFKTLKNGFKLPVIGLGTWGIGGSVIADYSRDREYVDILKKAIALGYSHIDTAEMYGAGHTEELIGSAIRGIDRNKLFITSKVYPDHLSRQNVIASAKGSLRRLGLKYLDLYLVHGPASYVGSQVHISETMGALDELVENGLIRFIGVSNFSLAELKEAQRYSKNKIICNQVEYNLATRNKGRQYQMQGIETEILPYCQENDIFFVAYSPLDVGLIVRPHAVLDKLAKKYKKTKAQIALNWLIQKKNVVVIPKASIVEHLSENLEASGWNLSSDDMKLLDGTHFKNPSEN